MAELGQQVQCHVEAAPSTSVAPAPDTLQRCSTAASKWPATTQQLEAPAPLAFEEILEGHPMRTTVRAIEPTICLSITTERFLSLLAENVEMAEGRRWPMDGADDARRAGGAAGLADPGGPAQGRRGSQAVDRALLLQAQPAAGHGQRRTAAAPGRVRPVTFRPRQRSTGGHLDALHPRGVDGHHRGHRARRRADRGGLG
ncbi:MAG: hypothetical protein R2712_16440 [Vicinamibacterales bacterium]